MDSKVAFITGSATGLGTRVAREFAMRGVNVILNYHTSEAAALKLAQELENGYGIRAQAIQADVANPNEAKRLAEEAVKAFRRIDYLINNAGPFIFKRTPIIEHTDEQWRRMVDGNLTSVFMLCRRIVPLMREQRFGRIVNVGFDRVDTVPAWVDYGPYAAAKTGVASLTRTLAMEEAIHGITVNMVCPGDIVAPFKEADIAAARASSVANTPIGRMGTGEDIARLVLFLCEDNSDMITGAVIPVTGGKDVLSVHDRSEA